MKWTPQNTMYSAAPRLAAVPRELERIAGEVGELDDLVALIVVPEDDEAIAERRLRGGNPRVHLVVRQAEIVLGERLALADALLLDLVKELDVHVQSGDRRIPPPDNRATAQPDNRTERAAKAILLPQTSDRPTLPGR